MIAVKRVYEAPSGEDGLRVLVERLWPRGMRKDRAKIDLWLKDVAPSPELRKWFGHDPAKWTEFQERYCRELQQHPQAVQQLTREGRKGKVTLVYAARDEQHNSAVVLKRFIGREGRRGAKHDATKGRQSPA